MVKVVITKVSEDYWYKIKTLPNIESLLTIVKRKGAVVVQRNWNYQRDPKDIARFWEGLTLDGAKEISECEFEVEIYDDYRE